MRLVTGTCLATLAIAAGVASMRLGAAAHEPARPRPERAPTATYSLGGVKDVACSTTVEACLAALPGVASAAVSSDRVTLAGALTGSPLPPEETVRAAIARTGHAPRARDARPREPVAEVGGAWLLVSVEGLACAGCGRALMGALRSVPGVRAVVARGARRAGFVVERDEATCSTAQLAAALRRLDESWRPAFSRLRSGEFEVKGMICAQCMSAIKLGLADEPSVAAAFVRMGSLTVVADPREYDAHRVIEAVGKAPVPT